MMTKRQEILRKIYDAELEEARHKCLKECAILELEGFDMGANGVEEWWVNLADRMNEVRNKYSQDAYNEWVRNCLTAELPMG